MAKNKETPAAGPRNDDPADSETVERQEAQPEETLQQETPAAEAADDDSSDEEEESTKLSVSSDAPPEDTGPGCMIRDEKMLKCRYLRSLGSAYWHRKAKDIEYLPESVAMSFAEAGTVVIIPEDQETATKGPAEKR